MPPIANSRPNGRELQLTCEVFAIECVIRWELDCAIETAESRLALMGQSVQLTSTLT